MIPTLPSVNFSSADAPGLLKISRLVLKQFPCSADKLKKSGATISGLDQNEEAILQRELQQLWSFLIYFQPKEAEFREHLTQVQIPEGLHDKFVHLWLEEGAKAVERGMKVTSSGLPRVTNVHCSTQLSISSNSSEQCRNPEIVIHISTDQGPRKVILPREKAILVYEELNNIQQKLDGLVE